MTTVVGLKETITISVTVRGTIWGKVEVTTGPLTVTLCGSRELVDFLFPCEPPYRTAPELSRGFEGAIWSILESLPAIDQREDGYYTTTYHFANESWRVGYGGQEGMHRHSQQIWVARQYQKHKEGFWVEGLTWNRPTLLPDPVALWKAAPVLEAATREWVVRILNEEGRLPVDPEERALVLLHRTRFRGKPTLYLGPTLPVTIGEDSTIVPVFPATCPYCVKLTRVFDPKTAVAHLGSYRHIGAVAGLPWRRVQQLEQAIRAMKEIANPEEVTRW